MTASAIATPGQKTTTVLCPFKAGSTTERLYAISGGFKAQGSVTESFLIDQGTFQGRGWTVTQSSGNTDSLTVYAYCIG